MERVSTAANRGVAEVFSSILNKWRRVKLAMRVWAEVGIISETLVHTYSCVRIDQWRKLHRSSLKITPYHLKKSKESALPRTTPRTCLIQSPSRASRKTRLDIKFPGRRSSAIITSSSALHSSTKIKIFHSTDSKIHHVNVDISNHRTRNPLPIHQGISQCCQIRAKTSSTSHQRI